MSGTSKRPASFDERIRRGYARSEPIVSIASDLGVTRNTVIGRARKLGLADEKNRLASLRRPEYRAALSAAKTAFWADPEKRKAYHESVARHHQKVRA